MPKSRKTPLVAALLFAILSLVLVNSRPKEPTYDGRTLSYWLKRRHEQTKVKWLPPAETQQTRKAIRSIGTNAIPWLLEWLHYEPNPVPQAVLNRVEWSFWTRGIGSFIRYGTGHSNERAESVVLAFQTLGTNAALAVEDLNSLMRDGTHPLTCVRATMALGSLGPYAFPALSNALFTTNQHERQLVALELFEMVHDPTVGTNQVLPLVIRAAQDPDPRVSKYAVGFLNEIVPNLSTNTPSPRSN